MRPTAAAGFTNAGHTPYAGFLLALFALALSAGGCGGDSPAPAAPTPTTPAPTPPPPAPPPAPEPVPTCQVGMVLRPGESCTYPGTSNTFTVNSDGTASFLFITSGSAINITSGNISLQATRQSNGSWLIGRVGASTGGSEGAATFRQGERIPDFPTGAPSVVSGGSFSSSGGVVTITLRRDGYVEYPEHRYTCDWSECGIRGGLVTAGVVVRTATGGESTGGLAPATQAEFEARVSGKQVTSGTFRLVFIAPGRIREIEDGTGYEGDYEYRRIGSNSGMIVYTYDATGNDPDRERSEVRFTFRTETAGTFEYAYFEGGTRTGLTRGSFELVAAPTGSTNRAPRAVGSIPAQTLTEDGSATTVNVSARFSDPDGDTLSYRAGSSRTSVVRVSVSGSRVTLTPRDTGTATVTVTATDPDGRSATQRFTVTVTAAAGGAGEATFREGERIPDFPTGAPNVVSGGSFSISGGAVTIALRRDGYVEYPEHRYTCDASECGIRGGLVTAGVIVRTATGGEGTPNRAPRAVGSIPDQTLTEDGSTTTVNVSPRFSDPDGDTLSYRATSSRTSVVRVSVSGSRVTLTPGDAGTATVTVTATDPGGLSATQRFTVTVNAEMTAENCSIENLGTLRGTTPRTRSGSLGRDCESPNERGKLARYFSFRLSEASEVQIDLESSAFDPLLLLREGSNISGRQIERDDDGGSGNDAQIVRELSAGTYTIEATSFRRGSTGAFTIRLVQTGGGETTTGADFEALNGLRIGTDGSVTLRVGGIHLSAGRGGCISGDATLNGRLYDYHWTAWQRNTGSGWNEVSGSRQTGQLCGYDLRSALSGNYRLVGDMTIAGERGRYRSENEVTVR